MGSHVGWYWEVLRLRLEAASQEYECAACRTAIFFLQSQSFSCLGERENSVSLWISVD